MPKRTATDDAVDDLDAIVRALTQMDDDSDEAVDDAQAMPQIRATRESPASRPLASVAGEGAGDPDEAEAATVADHRGQLAGLAGDHLHAPKGISPRTGKPYKKRMTEKQLAAVRANQKKASVARHERSVARKEAGLPPKPPSVEQQLLTMSQELQALRAQNAKRDAEKAAKLTQKQQRLKEKSSAIAETLVGALERREMDRTLGRTTATADQMSRLLLRQR